MTATLLSFPSPKPGRRSCWECVNYASNGSRSICMFFNEQVLDETAAASDCPVYESIEESDV